MDQTSLNPIDAAAVLVVLAAVFGYLNYTIVKLPHTIGLTIMGALASLAVVAADALIPGFAPGQAVRGFLSGIDFHAALMEGMLAFLLFAGALHVDLAMLFPLPVRPRDRNGGYPKSCGPKSCGPGLSARGRAASRVARRCPASPRRTLLAESLGKPSL